MVVLVPESGDDIQAMKAGLMEIADLFVINKADRQGANQALVQIQSMLEMRKVESGVWSPQVIKTSALHSEGIPELMEMLVAHQDFLHQQGLMRQNFRDRVLAKIRNHIEENVLAQFWTPSKKEILKTVTESSEFDNLIPGKVVNKLLDN